MAQKFVKVNGLTKMFSAITSSGSTTWSYTGNTADKQSILFITAIVADETAFELKVKAGSHFIWAQDQLFAADTQSIQSVDEIEGAIAAGDTVETVIRKFAKQISTINSTVSGISSTVAGHTTNLSTLNSSVSGLETTVGQHTTKLGIHDASINDISTRLSSVASNKTSLGTGVIGTNSSIYSDSSVNLDSFVFTNYDMIDKDGNSSTLHVLNHNFVSEVIDNEMVVAAFAADIDSRVNDLSTAIDLDRSVMRGHTTEISSIQSSISTVDGNVSALGGRVSSLETTVGQHTTSISIINASLADVSTLVHGGSVAEGNTHMVTGGQVHTAINAAITGATKYLGTVNNASELAALQPSNGDYARVAAAFDTYHVSDMLIWHKVEGAAGVWEVVHGESDTWREIKVNDTTLLSSNTATALNIKSGTYATATAGESGVVTVDVNTTAVAGAIGSNFSAAGSTENDWGTIE